MYQTGCRLHKLQELNAATTAINHVKEAVSKNVHVT